MDGAPQAICGFAYQRLPVSIGILLDTSGSMSGHGTNLLEIARAGINHLLDFSGAQDEYFLEYVSAGPKMQCLFSCDRAHLRAKLQATAGGKTALIDAVYLALNGMRKARFANQALVVFSDAGENSSVHTGKELELAFADSPVPLFLLVLRNQWWPPAPAQEINARHYLMEFANHSGGYATVVLNDPRMLALTEQLSTALHEPYMLYRASAEMR